MLCYAVLCCAANGVVHVINGVMGVLLETTHYLAAAPTFSTFYQALNVTGVLVSRRSG
jgi:hypothetical protein